MRKGKAGDAANDVSCAKDGTGGAAIFCIVGGGTLTTF